MKKIIWIPELEKVCPIESIQHIKSSHSNRHDIPHYVLRTRMAQVDGVEIPFATFVHDDEERTFQFEVKAKLRIGNIDVWHLRENMKVDTTAARISFIQGKDRSTLTFHPNKRVRDDYYVYVIDGSITIDDLASPEGSKPRNVLFNDNF